MAFPTETIINYVRAGYPVLNLISWEEERVENTLKLISGKVLGENGDFYVWSCTEGITNGSGASQTIDGIVEALDKVIQDQGAGFYIFKDVNYFFDDPKLIRKLKDIYKKLRKSSKTLFILSNELSLPNELAKEVTVIEIGLPDRIEAEKIFNAVLESFASENVQNSIKDHVKEGCLNALLGLGALEMELALRRTLVGKDKLDEQVVEELLEEKAQLVRKTGTLDFVRTHIEINNVGGLENLKDWLYTRKQAFSTQAQEFGLDTPKGVLLMGISGCGKSLCAKAIANAWNLPLLRLDLNRVYSGAVGSPEESFRRALKTVEASAPCVLWIDEIEAGLSRSGEKTSNSPASRIFGYFLTWMQEKEQPVFITATANQIDLLPPEVLRKGRFDEIFFVTLPGTSERKEIFKIHLETRGKNPASFDLDSLAKNTEGLSGAEIEQAIIGGLFESFSRDKELDDRDLIIAASSIVPLSTTMREEISKLERWAADRAVKASK